MGFPKVGTNIFWNCTLGHGMCCIDRCIVKSYVEEMILVPSLYQVNVGEGSPTASQSNVPFPWMSIS